MTKKEIKMKAIDKLKKINWTYVFLAVIFELLVIKMAFFYGKTVITVDNKEQFQECKKHKEALIKHFEEEKVLECDGWKVAKRYGWKYQKNSDSFNDRATTLKVYLCQKDK